MTVTIVTAVDGPAEALARLERIDGIRVHRLAPDESRAFTLPDDLLPDTQVLLCMYPPTNFSGMSNLRWIQVASSGYAQLFGLGLPERGIRASNTRGNVDVPIAEWTVAMMINLARDVKAMLHNQAAGRWEKAERYSSEIRGRTLGIWGYGCIGRETARLAAALGLRIHALDAQFYDRDSAPPLYQVPGTGDPDALLPVRRFRPGEEAAFLQELDFLLLTVPLTERTRGIVGERELRALPRHAYLLNPARGPLVQEEALLRALREGWIAGAALDTHHHYPLPPEHPLWSMANVIVTPHIAGSPMTPHFRERLWDLFVQNVERFVAGQPLLNELTPQQLAGQ